MSTIGTRDVVGLDQNGRVDRVSKNQDVMPDMKNMFWYEKTVYFQRLIFEGETMCTRYMWAVAAT